MFPLRCCIIGDEKDVGVTKAYQYTLVLQLHQPHGPIYYAWEEEVRRRALSMYNYDYANETVIHFIS